MRFRSLRVQRDFAVETARKLESLGYRTLRVSTEQHSDPPRRFSCDKSNSDLRESSHTIRIDGERIAPEAYDRPARLVAAGYIERPPNNVTSTLWLDFSAPVQLMVPAADCVRFRVGGRYYVASEVFDDFGQSVTHHQSGTSIRLTGKLRPEWFAQRFDRAEVMLVPGAFKAESMVKGWADIALTPK